MIRNSESSLVTQRTWDEYEIHEDLFQNIKIKIKKKKVETLKPDQLLNQDKTLQSDNTA